MKISPVRLNTNKNTSFKALTKRAANKLISYTDKLDSKDKEKCLLEIETLAKKVENSHTDIDISRGYTTIYKSGIIQDSKDERKGLFEGIKIVDTKGDKKQSIAFMPIRGLYSQYGTIKVDNGGTYEDKEVDSEGNTIVTTHQYFGLYPERFDDFIKALNNKIDINEGNIPDKKRTNREIKASIISHSK